MESIGIAAVVAILAVVCVFYLVACHSLGVIARKTGRGEVAEILAYVPILQWLTLIWSAGAKVWRFLVFGFGLVLASFLIGRAATKVGPGIGEPMAFVAEHTVDVALMLYTGWLMWRIAGARNLPSWMGLLVWVPLLNVFIYPYLAFHDGWARPHRLGAAAGLLLTVGLVTLGAIAVKRIDPETLEQSLAQWSESQAFRDLGTLDTLESEGPDIDLAPADIRTAESAPGQDASIRALFELKERFEALDSMARSGQVEDPAHRDRALGLITHLRADLARWHADLDAETYDELATHLIRVEATLGTAQEGGTEGGSDGAIRLAARSHPRDGTGSGPPAALAAAARGELAPVRPFPVQVSDACPTDTELRSRAGEKGEEEWCQQLAEFGGLRHGWYARYFDGGEPEQVGEYRDGLRVGVWTRFYPSGAVRAQAEFEQGLQHGWLLSFAESGERKKAVFFERGAPAGH